MQPFTLKCQFLIFRLFYCLYFEFKFLASNICILSFEYAIYGCYVHFQYGYVQKKSFLLGSAAVIVEMLRQTQKRKRNARRMWVRDIYLKRKEQGFYDNLIAELRISSPELFFNFVRMTSQSFEKLLSICGVYLKKYSPRGAIRPEVRLMVTLRFLATGDFYPSLGYSFRIAPSTICHIIYETCNVLWQILSKIYLKAPSPQEWTNIAYEYEQRWQLPNCIGSIDGKHVRIQAPPHSGSQFFNYKKFNSIVLLAISDAKYLFTYVNVGAYGAQSDGGILKDTDFGNALKEGTLGIPVGRALLGTNIEVPFYFVADEAFPLQINLMRPYSKLRRGKLPEATLIFNYRLSRARRTIENAFGIMASRFRIFHRMICAEPETVDQIIKAATCLHNFIKLQQDSSSLYCGPLFADYVDKDGRIVPGQWRADAEEINFMSLSNSEVRFGNRSYTKEAFNFRDYIKEYVNGIGSVPWQNNHQNF